MKFTKNYLYLSLFLISIIFISFAQIVILPYIGRKIKIIVTEPLPYSLRKILYKKNIYCKDSFVEIAKPESLISIFCEEK